MQLITLYNEIRLTDTRLTIPGMNSRFLCYATNNILFNEIRLTDSRLNIPGMDSRFFCYATNNIVLQNKIYGSKTHYPRPEQ